jgi:uncharacterized lipoprotein NlpE involved in copper resistance
VRYQRAHRQFPVMGCTFLILAVVFVLIGFGQRTSHGAETATTTGTITSAQTQRTYGRHATTKCKEHYTFQVGGQTYTGTQYEGGPCTILSGATTTVHYNPNHPSTQAGAADYGTEPMGSVFLFGMAGLFFVLGIVLLCVAASMRRRERAAPPGR